MKQVLFFTISLLVSNISFSQSNFVFVEGTSTNEYIMHKVVPKENWYSISRLYNVHPKDLATYNKTQPAKGLMVDQEIKVPIIYSNRYNIDTLLNENYSLIPVFYKVKKGDGLYAVAIAHNTTMQSIRQLNDLPTDVLQTGQIIQVGSIKVKTDESPLAQMKFELPSAKKSAIAVTPPTANTTASAEVATSGSTETADPEKTKLKQVGIEKVTDTDLTPNATVKKIEEPKTTEPIKTIEEPKVANPAVTTPPPVVATPKVETSTEEGFFKPSYKPKANVEKELRGSVFNVIAGEKENRFYVLVDDVAPGTVVQLKNKETGKIIFAKVLGKMPVGIGSNTMAISNAAAATMGGSLDKLIVSIKY